MNKLLILTVALSGLFACSEHDDDTRGSDALDQVSSADGGSRSPTVSSGLDGSVVVTPGSDAGSADAGSADAGRADASVGRGNVAAQSGDDD
jgi:hypothetical protein